jgi:hypothetical protein
MSGAQAADDRIDGPEQRAQGQEQIRLIEQARTLAAAGIRLCLRHERMSLKTVACPAVERF